VSLPIDLFPETNLYAEIRFLNMPLLKPHYALTGPETGWR